jgi:signal transduction histidine kinase
VLALGYQIDSSVMAHVAQREMLHPQVSATGGRIPGRLDHTIMILSISVIVLAGLLLSFVAQTITNPLKDVISGVRALSHGDYAYSIKPGGNRGRTG